jgi:beta-glucanase (GH16 family)
VTFSDDFNGPAGANPDPAKWVDYGRDCGAYAGWGKIRCGADEKLDGAGNLVLPATASWGSALQTKGKFSQRFGTFSAWMKAPAQDGYWPGWWLLNGTQTGDEQLTGEIDISEIYTTWKGSNARLHVWNGGSEAWNSSNMLCGGGTDFSDAFHKFTLKWTPAQLTFFVDDVQCGSVSQGSSPSPWPFGDSSRPAFLILDLAVGGAGQATPTADAKLLVDRVEVRAN